MKSMSPALLLFFLATGFILLSCLYDKDEPTEEDKKLEDQIRRLNFEDLPDTVFCEEDERFVIPVKKDTTVESSDGNLKLSFKEGTFEQPTEGCITKVREIDILHWDIIAYRFISVESRLEKPVDVSLRIPADRILTRAQHNDTIAAPGLSTRPADWYIFLEDKYSNYFDVEENSDGSVTLVGDTRITGTINAHYLYKFKPYFDCNDCFTDKTYFADMQSQIWSFDGYPTLEFFVTKNSEILEFTHLNGKEVENPDSVSWGFNSQTESYPTKDFNFNYGCNDTGKVELTLAVRKYKPLSGSRDTWNEHPLEVIHCDADFDTTSESLDRVEPAEGTKGDTVTVFVSGFDDSTIFKGGTVFFKSDTGSIKREGTLLKHEITHFGIDLNEAELTVVVPGLGLPEWRVSFFNIIDKDTLDFGNFLFIHKGRFPGKWSLNRDYYPDTPGCNNPNPATTYMFWPNGTWSGLRSNIAVDGQSYEQMDGTWSMEDNVVTATSCDHDEISYRFEGTYDPGYHLLDGTLTIIRNGVETTEELCTQSWVQPWQKCLITTCVDRQPFSHVSCLGTAEQCLDGVETICIDERGNSVE